MSERTEQPARDEARDEPGITVQGQLLTAGALIPVSVFMFATAGAGTPPLVIALAVTLFMFGGAALLTAAIATGIRLGNRS